MDEIISGFGWVITIALIGIAYMLVASTVADPVPFALFGAIAMAGWLGRSKAVAAREMEQSRRGRITD